MVLKKCEMRRIKNWGSCALSDYDNQKCLQTLPNVFCGTELPLPDNPWSVYTCMCKHQSIIRSSTALPAVGTQSYFSRYNREFQVEFLISQWQILVAGGLLFALLLSHLEILQTADSISVSLAWASQFALRSIPDDVRFAGPYMSATSWKWGSCAVSPHARPAWSWFR